MHTGLIFRQGSFGVVAAVGGGDSDVVVRAFGETGERCPDGCSGDGHDAVDGGAVHFSVGVCLCCGGCRDDGVSHPLDDDGGLCHGHGSDDDVAAAAVDEFAEFADGWEVDLSAVPVDEVLAGYEGEAVGDVAVVGDGGLQLHCCHDGDGLHGVAFGAVAGVVHHAPDALEGGRVPGGRGGFVTVRGDEVSVHGVVGVGDVACDGDVRAVVAFEVPVDDDVLGSGERRRCVVKHLQHSGDCGDGVVAGVGARLGGVGERVRRCADLCLAAGDGVVESLAVSESVAGRSDRVVGERRSVEDLGVGCGGEDEVSFRDGERIAVGDRVAVGA